MTERSVLSFSIQFALQSREVLDPSIAVLSNCYGWSFPPEHHFPIFHSHNTHTMLQDISLPHIIDTCTHGTRASPFTCHFLPSEWPVLSQVTISTSDYVFIPGLRVAAIACVLWRVRWRNSLFYRCQSLDLCVLLGDSHCFYGPRCSRSQSWSHVRCYRSLWSRCLLYLQRSQHLWCRPMHACRSVLRNSTLCKPSIDYTLTDDSSISITSVGSSSSSVSSVCLGISLSASSISSWKVGSRVSYASITRSQPEKAPIE